MKPIGFEKRADGCCWILEDENGEIVRRFMSPVQYEILVLRLMAEWLEDERRHAGYGLTVEGVARAHREARSIKRAADFVNQFGYLP